jgi:kumamolisin
VGTADAILLALVGAILTLIGNMVVSIVNNRNSIAQDRLKAASDRDLEELKAKYNLILQSIATNDPEAAKRNIEFFIGSRLLKDDDGAIRAALGRYNPVLPSPSAAVAPDRGVLPSDMARLYKFPPKLDGAGQIIGLIEFGGGFRPKQIAGYFEKTRQPLPEVVAIAVGDAKNDPSDAAASNQVLADIQLVGGIAPKAQLRVYFASSAAGGWTAALGKAVADHVGVLLINWGMPESEWRAEDLQAVNDALQAAAEGGVTIVTSVGDQGAAAPGTHHREVVFPAASPWVLAVGGTAMGSSAEGIASEVVWNDPNSGASGGGVSRIVEAPPWQSGLQVEGKPLAGRALPDVSAAAWNTLSVVGFGHTLAQIGGTSVAAAIWAGLIARINQGLGRNVGYLNPLLYQAIGPAKVLRPITKGDNSRPGVTGYAATDGWSPVAGWGAPDGERLLDWLQRNG